MCEFRQSYFLALSLLRTAQQFSSSFSIIPFSSVHALDYKTGFSGVDLVRKVGGRGMVGAGAS